MSANSGNSSLSPASSAAQTSPAPAAAAVGLNIPNPVASVSISNVKSSAPAAQPSASPFAGSGARAHNTLPVATTSASASAPAMAHSHTLKLIPASSSTEQPVDLVAKPKLASSVAQTTLQVPNLSGIIASGASGGVQTPVTTQGAHMLRIPSLPQSMRPANVLPSPRASAPVASAAGSAQVLGNPSLAVVRGGTPVIPRPSTTLLTMPKNGVNLAVVQQVPSVNKVVLQAPSPSGGKGITGLAQVPRATATTIIRPPAAPYTIRTPVTQHASAAATSAGGTTAIRLTSVTSGSATQPTVQFVPVSLATSGGATLRPATIASGAGGLPTVNFRQGPGAATIVAAPRPSQQDGTVRVTLVQPSSTKPSPSHVSQSNFYKPVTLTSQSGAAAAGGAAAAAAGQQLRATTSSVAQPVRIGPIAAGTARAVLQPVNVSQSLSQPLTVSLTPSQISVPLQQNIITTKQPLRFPAVTGAAGGSKILQMPVVAAAGSGSGQPSGVTIQKTTIPANTIPRTISLPYGTTTQVSAISKPAGNQIGQAIPVARVCPQPLSISSANSGPNLVTITSSVASETSTGSNPTLPANVYVARAPASSSQQIGQPLAINLTSTGPAKIISQSSRSQLSLDHGGTAVSSATQIIAASSAGAQSGAKVGFPSVPTRFLALPQSGATISLPSQAIELDKKFGTLSSSRPGILRRRDGDRDATASPSRDMDREDACGSMSGSTTLSATSSPGGGAGHLSGGEDLEPPTNPSPRKKLRKQQFPTHPQSWMSENDHLFPAAERHAEPHKRKLSSDFHAASAKRPKSPPVDNKPRISLLNSYRHTWRSRHNHFLRHSDVRVKEDRRPTVNELANQRQVLQKINGWKIYHLSSQMENIVDMEVELTKKLNGLQKRLEKLANPDLGSRDLSKVHELIKANLQRSKIVQDQVREAKDHALELFEHKSKVADIVTKYVSKRQVKKRELN